MVVRRRQWFCILKEFFKLTSKLCHLLLSFVGYFDVFPNPHYLINFPYLQVHLYQ